jgi:hypothetical protein
MPVTSVDNYKPTTGYNIKTALKAGAITTAIQTALLPSGIKASIYNTIIGKDLFLKQSENAAKNTIKNLQKAGSEKMASKINVAEAVKRAEEIYPEYVKIGKPVLKELGKSFALITGSIILGSFIADKFFANKAEKNAYLGKTTEDNFQYLKQDSRNSTTA